MATPVPVESDALITPENLRTFYFEPEQLPNRVWYRLTLPPHPQLDTQQNLAFVVGVWQQGAICGAPAWVLAVQLEVEGHVAGHCPIVTVPLILMGDLFHILAAFNIHINMVSLETGQKADFKTSDQASKVPPPTPQKGAPSGPNTVHSLPNDIMTRLGNSKNRAN